VGERLCPNFRLKRTYGPDSLETNDSIGLPAGAWNRVSFGRVVAVELGRNIRFEAEREFFYLLERQAS
jgi:hypothetical protein